MKLNKNIQLIGIGMIGDSNYIGTSLNGSIQEVESKGKNNAVSLKNYINKGDRTSHQVGHSKLKELDINDLFERKKMIEDMEAEITEAPKINSNTENLAVAEEANVDESVTADGKASNKM